MPPHVGRHLLRTKWVETFPCKTEKAQDIVRALISEIIPHFGLPHSLQSNNGPLFRAQDTQRVSGALGIKYRLHCAWRPQSFGKVEKANGSLKKTPSQACPRDSTLLATSFACNPAKN